MRSTSRSVTDNADPTEIGHSWRLAQSAEHLVYTENVAGSIPASPTSLFLKGFAMRLFLTGLLLFVCGCSGPSINKPYIWQEATAILQENGQYKRGFEYRLYPDCDKMNVVRVTGNQMVLRNGTYEALIDLKTGDIISLEKH